MRWLFLSALALCTIALGLRPILARSEPDGLRARIELGRRLFYDADLSIDGTMSCATCHEQHRGFADGNRTHGGVGGEPGRRNVPGLANVGRLGTLTWADPRVRSLEAQVAMPVLGVHPVEMGMAGAEAEIVRRLDADPCYRRMFAQAFPNRKTPIAFEQVARALAAFERTLVATPPAPTTSLARVGALVFTREGCAACHAGTLFTDLDFHRIEPAAAGQPDKGLAEVTGRDADVGAFRTPSLVDAGLTAPYLHDGSAQTLAEAIGRHQGVALSPADLGALVAYLDGLTDRRFVTDRRLALPQRACGRKL